MLQEAQDKIAIESGAFATSLGVYGGLGIYTLKDRYYKARQSPGEFIQV